MKFKTLGSALIVAAILFASVMATAQAETSALEGSKAIYAVTRDDQKQQIGRVLFTPGEGGVVRFKLTMLYEKFTDHFLSMKEFKCLEGAEVTCHVAYPYSNPQTIQSGDMAWLEHSLLFLFKQPRDFGAKLWNGSYYRFEPKGNGFIGHAQAIDLNHISAPSSTPNIPPFSADLRVNASPKERWIDHLLIE
jgi:hypothetical protein